ncbi:MAG: AAA family ATPase [Candidatus Aminicenantes bacterium]|nr:AAA family ATPase [Candidatus Aminicenantes bacterium]NIM84968.1 AAA family ATPase [Candidatus Aminicenantes bacterium]NIN24482.1 AAA family ATPase [Candidatus Aminicenantes bacterium]NIN48246.1 AAA family ATPase [Candidatus Aminicenantes bacterium]NIN91149.1 AAA family ATPase [Candidatus Aminicenantes bacterium]
MEKIYIKRLLPVPNRSFFLFGPRGVGKSTWLKKTMGDALFLDLLDSSLYLELSRNPMNLEALAGNIPEGSWIVIDEIQKIPTLLDEVHRLMEEKRWRFALCGSSARKLRRGGVNLLGGRAVTRNLDAFSYAELGGAFDPDFSLQWGLLPWVQLEKENAADILDSYVNTYIKEEIKEEGIIRRIPPFLRFLKIAGQLNGQLLNAQNISREAMVPRSSVDVYFSILEDTLLGHFLPAYRPGLKVREQTHPKFYWFDPGVARSAAGLLFDPIDRIWQGMALETMIYHELRVFNHTRERNREIFFYRTANGAEIDFVIETRKRQPSSVPHIVCIEVKLAEKWNRSWERAMRSLKSSDNIEVNGMIGIYTGKRAYHFDGLDVLPVEEFLKRLYQGNIF